MSIAISFPDSEPAIAQNDRLPTWSGCVDELIDRAAGGSADVKATAIDELRRMAQTADEYSAAESDLRHTRNALDAVGRQHDVLRNRRLHLYVATCRALEELGMLPAPAALNAEPEDPENDQYRRIVACREQLDRELDEHARRCPGGSGKDEPLLGDSRYVLAILNRWVDEFEYPFIAWAVEPPRGGAKPSPRRPRSGK